MVHYFNAPGLHLARVTHGRPDPSVLQTNKHLAEEDEIIFGKPDALLHGESVFGVERVEARVTRLVNRADEVRNRGDAVFQPAVFRMPFLLAGLIAIVSLPPEVFQGNQRNPRREQIDRLFPTACASCDRHVIRVEVRADSIGRHIVDQMV